MKPVSAYKSSNSSVTKITVPEPQEKKQWVKSEIEEKIENFLYVTMLKIAELGKKHFEATGLTPETAAQDTALEVKPVFNRSIRFYPAKQRGRIYVYTKDQKYMLCLFNPTDRTKEYDKKGHRILRIVMKDRNLLAMAGHCNQREKETIEEWETRLLKTMELPNFSSTMLRAYDKETRDMILYDVFSGVFFDDWEKDVEFPVGIN